MSSRSPRIALKTVPASSRLRLARKILFASAHSIVDFSNGAAVASLDLLQELAVSGFECQAFCTPKLDFPQEVPFEQIIGDLHEPYQVRPSMCGGHRAQVLYTRRRDVPITVIRLESTRHIRQQPEEIHAILEFFGKYLEIYQPDVLLTYGGDPISQGMMALARQRGIIVVFGIHNFGYTGRAAFSHVDHCLVASEFARRHYRDKLDLDCHVLPYAIDWDRVWVAGAGRDPQKGDRHLEDSEPVPVLGIARNPRFVTFVNPVLEKGVCAFVRIAQELGRRRPDIPFLVVESRGDRRTLSALGLGRDGDVNVQVMANTNDPRKFYALSRIVLLPSLWWENQPLVAIEAMINGIPVIGSDRGGIPEVLGESGFVLPLPERLTPVSREVPEAGEVEPWVETIVRLWDDRALYEEQSRRAREEARRWHPDRLRPLYAEFFRNVVRQAGPSQACPPAARGAVGTQPGVELQDSAAPTRLVHPNAAFGRNPRGIRDSRFRIPDPEIVPLGISNIESGISNPEPRIPQMRGTAQRSYGGRL